MGNPLHRRRHRRRRRGCGHHRHHGHHRRPRCGVRTAQPGYRVPPSATMPWLGGARGTKRE